MALYANLWGPMSFEYPGGQHAVLAEVEVLDSFGDPAVRYTDKGKSTVDSDPAKTDSYGNLAFWVDPGEYTIVAFGLSMDITVPKHPAEPDGGGAGDSAQVYDQPTPAATWIIPHAKGRIPVVEIYIAGEMVISDIDATDTIVTVTHAVPVAGKAILI